MKWASKRPFKFILPEYDNILFCMLHTSCPAWNLGFHAGHEMQPRFRAVASISPDFMPGMKRVWNLYFHAGHEMQPRFRTVASISSDFMPCMKFRFSCRAWNSTSFPWTSLDIILGKSWNFWAAGHVPSFFMPWRWDFLKWPTAWTF